MSDQIILNGIGIEDLLCRIKDIVKAEVRSAEEDRIRPITKKQAYTALEIAPRTLDKALKELNKTSLYYSDIAVIRHHLGSRTEKFARTARFR